MPHWFLGDSLKDILIERATPAHVDGILKLAEENSPERGGDLTGTLPREAVEMTIPMIPSLVAIRDGQVIGFLMTWEKESSGHPCVKAMLEAYPGSQDAYVYGPVCVAAAFRGQGLAGRMFNELRILLPRREGILFIKDGNESSIRAHNKMGVRKAAEFTYDGKTFSAFSYTSPKCT